MGKVYEEIDLRTVREALIKLIAFMVRQSHHKRNQYITVRPEPVEGLNQSFLSLCRFKNHGLY